MVSNVGMEETRETDAYTRPTMPCPRVLWTYTHLNYIYITYMNCMNDIYSTHKYVCNMYIIGMEKTREAEAYARSKYVYNMYIIGMEKTREAEAYARSTVP